MNNEIKIGNIFKLPIITDRQCCVMSADFRYQIKFDDSDSNVRNQVEYVCHAINNHDRLVEESKRLRGMVNCASSEVKSLSNSIDVLEVWIDNESRCAEWVSIDVIMYRLGKIQARLSKLLSKLDGEK